MNRNLPSALFLGMLAALTTSACNQQRNASKTEKPAAQTKAVGGLTFYYGIVKGAAATEDAAMHMGQPQSPASYHIVLALFETASKTRIADASVAVRVGRSSTKGTGWLPMKFMRGPGTESYGRYAGFPVPGRYLIDFQVRRDSKAAPITAHFVFERPG